MNLFFEPQFLVAFFAGFLSICIGFFMFLPRKDSNARFWFFVTSFFVGIWSMLISFSIAFADSRLFLIHAAIFTSWLLAPAFLLTSLYFYSKETPKKIRISALAGIPIVIILHIAIPWSLVKEVVLIDANLIFNTGKLYFISPLYLVIYFGGGFWYLWKSFKKSGLRTQAQIVASMIGVGVALLGVFIGNTFSPWVRFTYTSWWFGPVFALIGIVSFAYMIIEKEEENIPTQKHSKTPISIENNF